MNDIDEDQPSTEAEPHELRRFRLCLMVSILIYLGLAALCAQWRPDLQVISWILVIFAGHSAAYLLTHFMRGDAAGPNHPDV